MKILVTGGAGFIGSHLIDSLLNLNHNVIGIDNFNSYYNPKFKRANIKSAINHPNLTFYEEDFCNEKKCFDIVKEHRPDSIIHLGGYGGVRYSIKRAPLYTDVNIRGSINLLEAARIYEIKNFVFASTSSLYGHTKNLPFIESDPSNSPLAPYPATKKAIEIMGYTYHNLHNLNFTALRFFSVYGERGRPDMMPFMVTDSIYRGKTFKLFDGGKMKRDWTYVSDIVNGIIKASLTPLGYEIINLGRGEPVLMSDFVSIIEDLLEKKANPEIMEAPQSEPKITFANIDKAKKLLDYYPLTKLEDGLKALVSWYKKEIARN